MKKRSDVLLAVFLVGAVALNVLVWRNIRSISSQNVAMQTQTAQINAAVDDFDAKCKAIDDEFAPKIAAVLAEIKVLEEEAKKPIPEPTKEQILRELDKLWVAK
jgi:phage host-nuclease inhibitor protein Gam